MALGQAGLFQPHLFLYNTSIEFVGGVNRGAVSVIVVRYLLRVFLAVLFLLVLVFLALWIFRLPIGERLATHVAQNAGLSDIKLNLVELSLDGARIKSLSAKGLQLDRIDISYSPVQLWRERRIKTLSAGPGQISGQITPEGKIRIGGLLLPADNPAAPAFDPSRLPLDIVTLEPIRIFLSAERGMLNGVVAGSYDRARGGAFEFEGQAEQIGIGDFAVDAADFSASLALGSDGLIDIRADGTGGGQYQRFKISKLSLDLHADGTSWIAAIDQGASALDIKGSIELKTASLPFGALAADAERLPQRLSARGAFGFQFRDNRLQVDLDSARPAIVETDRGDRLEFTPLVDEPLVRLEGDGLGFAVGVDAALREAVFATRATGSLEVDGTVRTALEFIVPAQKPDLPRSDATLVLGDLSGRMLTVIEAGGITADLAIDGRIDRLTRAPLTLEGIVFDNDRFRLVAERTPEGGLAGLALRKESAVGGVLDCVSLSRVGLAIPDQDVRIGGNSLALCSNGGDFLRVESLMPLVATVQSVIQGGNFFYDQGALMLAGEPPVVDIDVAYASASERLSVSGKFFGGNAILNDMLRMTGLQGNVEASFDPATVKGNLLLDKGLIAQTARPETVAPFSVSGRVRYDNQAVDFTGDFRVPGGERFASVSGGHNAANSRGNLEARIDDLIFLPDGLQPADILPPLKGQIGDAVGTLGGVAALAWDLDENALSSSGTLTTDNLSFAGPGTAVTRTVGIDGIVRLDSLFPVRSDGHQTVTIDALDLGALRLENGLLEIEFPGDNTLNMVRGVFPWFGGKLGVYDTVARFDGSEVFAALRASDIDLGQFLSFLDIDGLTGAGIVEGTLPLVSEDGRLRIENGFFRSTTPGVIRFNNTVSDEAGRRSELAGLAFNILRDLNYESLEATINGSLDGQLNVGMVFEGTNDVLFRAQEVTAPVIYRITIEGPLPDLLSQRMQFTNFNFVTEAQ